MKTSDSTNFALPLARLRLAFVAACVSAATALFAQVPVPKTGLPPSGVAKQEAHAAFKTGDTATALAKLQASVKTGAGAPHADLQVGRALVEICCIFRNAGDSARAKQLATLSLAKVALPESRMTNKDAAASLALAGEVSELQGNWAAAKSAYQRAVALDPPQKHVADRLQRIVTRENRANAKPAANALLQQRAPAPTIPGITPRP